MFKKYRRKQIAELRPITETDIQQFKSFGKITANYNASPDEDNSTSISEADLKNGSPKIGDMIARNPKNHQDSWLVSEKYFKDNFEELL